MLNGEFMPSDKPCLNFNNRGLLWGDSFSIQLRGNACLVYDFDMYFKFIKQMTETLGMRNDYFKPKSFANDIMLLLKKNRIYMEFYITITIFRNCTNNKKLATDNTFSVLISAESLPHEYYSINTNGIFTEVLELPEFAKPDAIPNFPFELLCAKQKEEKGLDDIIITDSNGNFRRSIQSDIFFMKDNSLIYASSPETISANKVFSTRVAKLASQNLGMKIYESPINEQNIKEIDSMFLADPINGIRWVVGLGRKRFFKGNVEKIAYEVYNYYKTEIDTKRAGII